MRADGTFIAVEVEDAAAADAELAAAEPLHDNAFKVELAERTMTAVLAELAEVQP